MKRTICGLAAALLLLSGCGRERRPTAEDAAARYRGAAVTAELTASAFGEYPADYGLTVACTEGGDATVTLTAPADVAGVEATLAAGSAVLRYEGAALETLLPAQPGYVPCDALPRLVETIARDAPLDWGYEDCGGEPALALTFQDDLPGVAGLRRAWLRESDLALLAAEYYLDDSLALRLQCPVFTLTPAAE